MVYLTRALVLRIAAQLSGGSATSCCSFAVFIGLIAGLLIFPIPGAVGQGAADCFAEIHEQSLGWNNRPATDAMPVAFSIDEVHLSVPRNYLVWMDTMRVSATRASCSIARILCPVRLDSSSTRRGRRRRESILTGK